MNRIILNYLEDNICIEGDMSLRPQWIAIYELKHILEQSKEFSPIDKAAIKMFIQELDL
jgi:hypothetical protein